VTSRIRAARIAVAALGVACSAVPSAAQDVAARVARVEQRLMPRVVIRGEPVAAVPLAGRMAALRVPAVSVTVINGGKIEWAHAWGLADLASLRAATPATLFQAASISKPVAATAALALVEQGKLDLDTDVNRYLASWRLPSDSSNNQPVTIRHLVTHTAGLTVHGFPGYARSARIPGTAEVLDGKGNTAPVRRDLPPGSQWRYSGGGYTVLQLAMADVADHPFADVMRDLVLGPAGMTASTYQQPLPESRWNEAATGYRPDGQPVEESWHVYPEQAAAGLWTTPTDLARWGLAILAAFDGRAGGPLSPEMARRMLEPGLGDYGLGPGIGPERRWFGHGGSNEGFRCQLVVFMDGRGAVVMTNSDRGGALVSEILATLADEYGWPDYRVSERTAIAVTPAALAELAGRYQVQGLTDVLVISVEGGRLYAQIAGALQRTELLSESATLFFTRDQGVNFQFERDGGRISAVQVMGRRAVRQP
jgi:CubicO group peptidase (beta-lactamase class C family)